MIIIMIIIGGVKSSMYRDLPSPLVAEFGFQVQFSILIHNSQNYYNQRGLGYKKESCLMQCFL